MSWKVVYKNVYGDLEGEVYGTRDQADSRYDELSRRCDLYWSTLRDGEDIPDTCDIDWVDEPEEVDEDGSSACALGTIPTGTFEKPRKDMKLKENEEFWIDVAAPEYRGAPAPKFDPKAINEPRIPDGMRCKEYTWSEDEFTDGGVILDWVTQETYTPEDREVFKAEVKRALKENGFKGKVQVNLNVRGEDDIETFVIDMGKNESLDTLAPEIQEYIRQREDDVREAVDKFAVDLLNEYVDKFLKAKDKFDPKMFQPGEEVLADNAWDEITRIIQSYGK